MEGRKFAVTLELGQDTVDRLAYATEVTGMSSDEIIGMLLGPPGGIEGAVRLAWARYGLHA